VRARRLGVRVSRLRRSGEQTIATRRLERIYLLEIGDTFGVGGMVQAVEVVERELLLVASCPTARD
jgi:hypothetical protein